MGAGLPPMRRKPETPRSSACSARGSAWSATPPPSRRSVQSAPSPRPRIELQTRASVASCGGEWGEAAGGRRHSGMAAADRQVWASVSARFKEFSARKDSEEKEAHSEQKNKRRSVARPKRTANAEADLTKAKRAVWVGHIPFAKATEPVVRAAMAPIGEITSCQVEPRQSDAEEDASWAIVIFQTRDAATSATSQATRMELGATATKDWKCEAIRPDKLESFNAQFALTRAEISALAAEGADTDIARAQRTVWAGWISQKTATRRAINAAMTMIGPVVSVHVRVKDEAIEGPNTSWALVLFKRKEDASRACDLQTRMAVGASISRKWKVEPVEPEKLGSLEAKFALSGMVVDAAVEDKAAQQQRRRMERARQHEIRQREKRRIAEHRVELDGGWQRIQETQRLAAEANDKDNALRQKRSERKLHRRLLQIVMESWRLHASVQIRAGRRDFSGKISSQALEIETRLQLKEPEHQMNPAMRVAMQAIQRKRPVMAAVFVALRAYTDAVLSITAERTAQKTMARLRANWRLHQATVSDDGIAASLDAVQAGQAVLPRVLQRLLGATGKASLAEAMRQLKREERRDSDEDEASEEQPKAAKADIKSE